jgi:hypothetical protein
MPRLSWTINLVNGPAVGSHTGSLDECCAQLEAALREAMPDWTPAHQAAFAPVRAALLSGRRHVTAPSFLVTVED